MYIAATMHVPARLGTLLLLAAAALGAAAGTASAQITVRPCDGPESFVSRPAFARPDPPAAIDLQAIRQEPVTLRSAPPRPAMLTTYAAFVGLQALDVHSTLRGVRLGGREANPFVRWVSQHPVALTATKAASAAAAIALAERLRKHHPWRAYILMTAIDGAYAAIVVHNYGVR